MSGEVNYNPKQERARIAATKKPLAFQLGDLGDPIGAEIQDPDTLKRLYSRWPLIPYAGSVYESNDGLLYFFDGLRHLSPTTGACHNSIKSFLFGEKLRIVKRQSEDFAYGEDIEPVSTEQAKEYGNFLEDIYTEQSHTDLSKCLYDEIAANGNIFIELVHTETNGVRSSAIYHHPTQHCRYWATMKGEAKKVMVSEVFHEDYFRRYPPRVIPVFPDYALEEDGTRRTIIHVKNGNFKWYGRPASAGAWIDGYSEYKERHYLTKIAASNFTGQGVMEVEEEDVETTGLNLEEDDAIDYGYQNLASRFDSNFSASSDDPQTFLFMTRPHGASPAFIYEFKLHTSENFYDTIGNIHRRSIIENWAWSERLLGNAVSEGFSTDSFVSEMKVKEISVLSFYRDFIVRALNTAYTECAKWQEREDFIGLGVELPTKVEELSNLKGKDYKDLLTAYGTGVRAGAITSTEQDEIYFRSVLGLVDINENVAEAWQEDGGYRRPITLKTSEDSEAQKSLEE